MERISETQSGSGTHGLLYFILGAATGAGLALLFAPAEGKVTRDEMARWLKDKREKGREVYARYRADHNKELAGV